MLDLVGLPASGVRHVFYGAVGVIVFLTIKGIPFAYLAISGALRGLGEEYEAAARVHGGGRLAAAEMMASLMAPACWSAFAIVFAESVSDFGVAATLANDAHFPVATYTLYQAVDSFPVRFPVAAAVGWVLMGMAGLALLAQTRALRGRSWACGASAVYITHDQSEAFALADHIGVLDHGQLIQLASPEEIYRRPATPLVAHFTGAAGELPGRVMDADRSSMTCVQISPAHVRVRPIGTLAAGAAVTVLIRPVATSILSPGETAAPGSADLGIVSGTVADVAYRGRGYDHVVLCPTGTLSAVHSAQPHPRGMQVDVQLDPDGCLAYQADEASAGHDPGLTAVTLTMPAPARQLAQSAPARRTL